MAIRAAKCIGYDRIPPAEDDRETYSDQEAASESEQRQEEEMNENYSPNSGSRRSLGDVQIREISRSQWWILMLRDWSATREMGNYLVHPSSFTTNPPIFYAYNPSEPGNRIEIWSVLIRAADIARRYAEVCAEAEANKGKRRGATNQVSYEITVQLDQEIQHLLHLRPIWLQAENSSSGIRKCTYLVKDSRQEFQAPFLATIVSTSLWHCQFIIVRN